MNTPHIIFMNDLAYISEGRENGSRVYEIPDDVKEALHEYDCYKQQKYIDIIWEAVKLTEGYKKYNKEEEPVPPEPTPEPTRKQTNTEKYIKSLKEEIGEITNELNDNRRARDMGCKNTYKRNKEIEELEDRKWHHTIEIGVAEGRLERGDTSHSMVSYPDGRRELPFHTREVLADGLKKGDVIVIVTARELDDDIFTYRVERVNINTITVSTSNQYGIIAWGSTAKLPKNTYPYRVVNKNIRFLEKGTFKN